MEKITITKEQAGKRVDKFLSLEFFLYSRGEIIRKIKNGEVRVNGKSVKPSHVLEENDVVELENFSKESVEEKLVENKNIPLEIIFQNKNFVVINKQAGVQVHPSHNEKKNTLVNVIIARFPEIADVHDDSTSDKLRPGIVHRLDKDTSGVLVIARNTKAFAELKKLFKDRKIEKSYVAICQGIFAEKAGTIEKPIARSASYRKQVIARKNTKTIVREAVTKYEVAKEFGEYSLVNVFPKTGRMHQIRIHLASIDHSVVGDSVYGNGSLAKRQLLHARELKFELFGEKYDFLAPMPKDFEEFMAKI